VDSSFEVLDRTLARITAAPLAWVLRDRSCFALQACDDSCRHTDVLLYHRAWPPACYTSQPANADQGVADGRDLRLQKHCNVTFLQKRPCHGRSLGRLRDFRADVSTL